MKDIKIINKISINGEYIDAEKLTQDERKKISEILNERAMRSIGFNLVKTTE
jgi:hypothetical protein